MTDHRDSFEVSYVELADNLDHYVQRVFDALSDDPHASFLVLPRGSGFVSAKEFRRGYDALVEATTGFGVLDNEAIVRAVLEVPMTLIVLRAVLGLSPPEWASLATMSSEHTVSQGFARGLERSIRMDPTSGIGHTPTREAKIRALVAVACKMLRKGAARTGDADVHRLDKVDTVQGILSLKDVVRKGVGYEELLYERFLGRPFASHRDSVSELIGDKLEDRIEKHLLSSKVSFVRSGRGESIPGWEQNPDFFCPDPESTLAVIEAKMTNDDGTARDKVARVLRLAAMRDERERAYQPGFEVIACISGRGFAVRKGDMRDLLIATRGKVFTYSQIDVLTKFTTIQGGRRRD